MKTGSKKSNTLGIKKKNAKFKPEFELVLDSKIPTS